MENFEVLILFVVVLVVLYVMCSTEGFNGDFRGGFVGSNKTSSCLYTQKQPKDQSKYPTCWSKSGGYIFNPGLRGSDLDYCGNYPRSGEGYWSTCPCNNMHNCWKPQI